jgi:hypothetical protein
VSGAARVGQRLWSDAEVNELRRLRGEGATYREIGAALGRSKHSVRNKINDLGLAVPRRKAVRPPALIAAAAAPVAGPSGAYPGGAGQEPDSFAFGARAPELPIPLTGEIAAHLDSLPGASGWPPEADLLLVEGLCRGMGKYGACAALVRAGYTATGDGCVARFKVLYPWPPTPTGQARLLALLRAKAGRNVAA